MIVRIQQSGFDARAEIERLVGGCENPGAVVSFEGRVRTRDQRGEIREFFLEHYPGMTEKQVRAIAGEAKKKFAIQDCLVIHRYGRLKPGEAIVLVAAVSVHRGDAFDAARFLMDWLKTKAPFWKKEVYGSGGHWVEARREDEEKARSWDK